MPTTFKLHVKFVDVAIPTFPIKIFDPNDDVWNIEPSTFILEAILTFPPTTFNR